MALSLNSIFSGKRQFPVHYWRQLFGVLHPQRPRIHHELQQEPGQKCKPSLPLEIWALF